MVSTYLMHDFFYQLNIIKIHLIMTEEARTFGLPSIPRETMPSMFEILGWFQNQQINNCCDLAPTPQNKTAMQILPSPKPQEQKIIENISLVKSEYQKESPKKKRARSVTKSGIYQMQNACLKRSNSQKNCSKSIKVIQPQKVQPVKKKLDPNIIEDAQEIAERKKRIKKFEYVTRDLSNSAFTTYYGKPAWEVYGRCNSNPKLLTHNVMPHKGQNKPKDVQSYYSALIKGKKQSLSTYVPRKAIQEIMPVHRQEEVQPINLPIEVPDLINNVRFTSQVSRKKKDTKIPSNKIATLKLKNAKKEKAKGEKKRKSSPTAKINEEDGLKFMNTRQNLLKLLESKKTNKSKLAWKVTQCYPFDLTNEEKLKQSTIEWKHTKAAGSESIKCDPVKELISFEQNLSSNHN